ncbi:MAG: response regulator [Elusimicrobia bacterium]|nr:response regulator [Elusimicrobiota bacterium]
MEAKTILLVEDNEDDAHLTLAAFKDAGISARFVVAKDGLEALGYLSGDAALPGLVLLDLNLPKLSGQEILERIRAAPRTATLPVVILTSSVEEGDLARCYALGANSFVRKAVDFKEFQEIACVLGRYWLDINVPAPPRRAA